MHRYLSRIVRTLILQRFLGEKRIRYLIFEDFFTFQILPILRRRYFVAIFFGKSANYTRYKTALDGSFYVC